MPITWSGSVHGVGIHVASADLPFLRLVGATYHHFAAPALSSADIKVEFSYALGRSRKGPADTALPWRLGTQLYSDGGDRLAYCDRAGTFVAFNASQDPWEVQAVHTEAPLQTLARLLRLRPPVHTGNRQIAMRLAVHFPVFWRLSASGIFPVHGASVARDGAALVFAGLNGCGKSTLALTLCQSHGFKLISDNFTLHDGRRILAFPETLRLAQQKVAGLPLRRASQAPVFGKHQFIPADELVSPPAEAAAVFYTVLDREAKKTEIVEVNAAQAELWLEAQHDFLCELPQHSYLRLLSVQTRHPFPLAAARAAQRRLLEGCRAFLLRISTQIPPEESVEQVLACY